MKIENNMQCYFTFIRTFFINYNDIHLNSFRGIMAKRFFLLILLLVSCAFLATGCHFTKTELVYPQKAEILIKNIPEDILYFSQNSSNPDSYVLFTARDTEGLGLNIHKNQKTLNHFKGIMISVSDWIPKENISLAMQVTGNPICQELIHLNTDNFKIEVKNESLINSLITCRVETNISATNLENKTTHQTNFFNINFNLTMNDYIEKNDPFVDFFFKILNISNISQLELRLKSKPTFDFVKLFIDNSLNYTNHAYGITGVFTLHELDLTEAHLNLQADFKFLDSLKYIKSLKIIRVTKEFENIDGIEELKHRLKEYDVAIVS